MKLLHERHNLCVYVFGWVPYIQRFIGISYNYCSWSGSVSSWNYHLPNNSTHTKSCLVMSICKRWCGDGFKLLLLGRMAFIAYCMKLYCLSIKCLFPCKLQWMFSQQDCFFFKIYFLNQKMLLDFKITVLSLWAMNCIGWQQIILGKIFIKHTQHCSCDLINDFY